MSPSRTKLGMRQQSYDNNSSSKAVSSMFPEIKIKKVFRIENKGRPLVFSERQAYQAYKDQAKIEYKLGKKGENNKVPVTNEIAFLESLIQMQDWKRKLHVATTLQH